MNFNLVFNNKTIRIPLLQRDYVQGGKESVIVPFVDSLIDQSSPSDLNYIYGYTDSEGCFIPVDGQQRLTTLWLLYLYASAKAQKADDFRVDFTFLSREFAQDFCERLKTKLPSLLASTTLYKSLDKEIRDQYWFIDSWYNNVTVRNMLNTLKYIHRKCASKNAKELWEFLSSGKCNISFAFLDMSPDKGLDDDIYIKMNGRGRPLSVYENLKSWIDEKVNQHLNRKDVSDEDKDWCKLWIRNIDNKWTQMFWENRNQTQAHPEEIDDEQLYCVCNLLIIYWMENQSALKKHLVNIQDTDPYLYEELLRLYPKVKENDGVEVLIGQMFDAFQITELPSLIWIERLNLMPIDFLRFVYDSLNRLCSIQSLINDNSFVWYIGGEAKSNTRLYELSMRESTYGRTLPLLYSVLMINGEKRVKDWLRITRNLILNTSIEKEKLPEIFKDISNFYQAIQEHDIYEILANGTLSKELLKSFSGTQLKEEEKKAKLPESYYTVMEGMENTKFFSGSINVMFKLRDWFVDAGYNFDDFSQCTKILMEIFDGSDGGIKQVYDSSNDRLLRRTLMCFPPHFYGMYRNAYWSFCQNMGEWRQFLNGQFRGDDYQSTHFETFRNFIMNVCLPAIKTDAENIEKNIKRCMQASINSAVVCYEDQLREDSGDKFHLHFIHHIGVWDYMGTSRCSWPMNDDHGYSIFLKTSNGNNSNRMELRTYCLYLDYVDTSCVEAMKNDRQGWHVGCYPREDTCLYFEINTNNHRKVAIDVCHNRRKEDDYSFNVFVRPTNEEEVNRSKYDETNAKILLPIFNQLNNIRLQKDDKSGRYVTNESYSRENVIQILRILLPVIKKNVKDSKVQ